MHHNLEHLIALHDRYTASRIARIYSQHNHIGILLHSQNRHATPLADTN